jgi:hypothetical protein
MSRMWFRNLRAADFLFSGFFESASRFVASAAAGEIASTAPSPTAAY